MIGRIEETSASSKPDPRLDPTRLFMNAAQNRIVFYLMFGKLLGGTNEFLGAHALTQGVAAHECRPCDVPQVRGVIRRRRHHQLAVAAERRGAGMAFQNGMPAPFSAARGAIG